MTNERVGNLQLDSWKAIAVYLNRDVRTAIRWEQDRGLPVHRLPGGTRSGVYAFAAEIDGWLAGQVTLPRAEDDEIAPAIDLNPDAASVAPSSLPTQSSQVSRQTFRRWILAAVGVSAILVLAVSLHSSLRISPVEPAQATFTADSVQAWDGHHRLLWEYRFPQAFANTAAVGEIDPSTGLPIHDEGTNRASLHDLYGDGRKEILAITLFRRSESPSDVPRWVLSCFSTTGKLLWNYEPTTMLIFGDRTHSAPWVLKQLIVSDEPGPKTIWINVIGPVWGKSFVARLDAFGHSSIQFVNSGEIEVLRRFHTPHGSLLWIGGFNDEYDTASLAVMSDAQPYAVSPQTAGTRYACKNCGRGDPLAYFVFPRYDMSRALHIPYNPIYAITSDALSVEVHQSEVSRADRVIYDFPIGSDLKPVGVRYAASFWPNHLELERQGKLDHSLEKCPDRLRPPPVRIYRNGGWTAVKLSPDPSR